MTRRPLGALFALTLACSTPASTPVDSSLGEASTDTSSDTSTKQDAAPDAPELAWAPCQGTYECATLPVPRDPREPQRPTLSLALLRARARDPSRRLGVLLWNPGGPGGSGVRQLPAFWRSANGTMNELTQRFDWVGFDPRGVGASRPAVDCVDDAALERLRALDLGDDSDAARGALESEARAFITGCQARTPAEVLTAVGSPEAAEDLDRIREALGEEVINYLGISYGTWLGALYAQRFPRRVRAFALDSAASEEGDRRERSRRRARAFEAALTRFLGWCAETPSCGLRRASPEATGAAFDALARRLGGAPLAVGARRAGPAELFSAVVLGLRARQWPPLAAALAAAERGDGAMLLSLADADRGRQGDGSYFNNTEAFAAISFLDSPFPSGFTVGDYTRFVTAELVPLAPRMGRWASQLEFVAALWPLRRALPAPPLGATTAPPILLLGGLHDPATPYELAQRMRDTLANGSHLVTYEGDGHAQVQQSACARAAVVRFLVDPSRAPATDRCPAE
ncbi:MAG: alpha/beta fold hydrolase [Deltaproteobacteria bacterium]|nr:alpha/beta fold hydrolase [Deltaproteobacteria bacterium]